MNNILARPGETLTEHTRLVVERVMQLKRLRPLEGRLYDWLFYAALLHDSGKLARGFQRGLRSRKARWGLRHEVLSLAFTVWFDFQDDDHLWILAAIATHHRDLSEILRLYRHDDLCSALITDLDVNGARAWYDWLSAFPVPDDIERVTMRPFVMPTVHDLRAALNRLRERSDTPGLLLRGTLMLADHAASARTRPFDAPHINRQKLMPLEPYPHQIALMRVSGHSARLIAPTGSGKTEAALLWATGLMPPRIFYMLPYRASMNAMAQRLEGCELTVGLQHGHALQALYRRLLEEGSVDAEQLARAKLNTARLQAYPVRVFSPYHLLRALYRFKGYEASLTDCYGSHIIVDEIHAYEPEKLAMILEMLRLLREQFNARILIMTATLPPVVETAVAQALPGLRPVEADAATFRRFRRHVVYVENGDLLEALDRIRAEREAGKAVLVTVNTVKRARQVAALLDCPTMVLHSRFNSRDRWKREKAVLDIFGVGRQREGLSPVVVATQVIEVSLNVDFDVLYSDPAPLDALLQRFGRVNRGRQTSALAPVYVFEQPPAMYLPPLVEASIDVLRDHHGMEVDEALTGEWLAAAYAPVREDWQRRYDASRADFRRIVLDDLRPFESADEGLRELFNFSFDGIEILPLDLEDEYLALIDSDPIAASELLVPLAYWQYKMLERQGRAWPDDTLYYTDVPYSSELGLRLNEDAEG